MPCSQMISMNIRPPRPSADRNVESVPKVKALMRKSGRRNIGKRTRVSITANASSSTIPPPSAPSTNGLVQPIVWPP